MKAIFLTGTDTGAGKTLVSCAILRALSRRGLRVAAYKPAETGCRVEGDHLVGEDCEKLAAAGSGQRPEEVAAYLFREPAAPLVAAEAEGACIEHAILLDRYAAIAVEADFVLVESAGGLLVPLADGFTTRDLARDLGLTAVCVVASRLGCINHALLTLEVLRSSGIPIAGYVVNELGGEDPYAVARGTNRAVLGRFSEERVLGTMPRVEVAVREDFDALADLAERFLDLDAIAAAG